MLVALLLFPSLAEAARPRSAQGSSTQIMPPRRPADLPAVEAPASRPTDAQGPKAAPQPRPDDSSKPVEATRPPRIDGPDAVAGPQADFACLAALIAVHGSDVRTGKIEPGQDAACGVIEPVVVEAMTIGVDTGRRRIAFQPPVTLSCAMATAVAKWLEASVQPLAKGHFGRDLTGLRVGGGHECRRRNRSANGPLSEHSTGRALDIFAFVTGDGKTDGTVVVEKADGAGHGLFLTAIRQSACGAFMTSLGPGSDAAHANHLHVDIQPRRAASSRFCQ
jgi:hypothetical protein